MKIRGDLDGVVYVRLPDGGVACLQAGDTVPDGVTVGDHLTNDGVEGKDSDAGQPRRRRNPTRPPADG